MSPSPEQGPSTRNGMAPLHSAGEQSPVIGEFGRQAPVSESGASTVGAMADTDQSQRFASLRRWNISVGAAHLVQAVVILALSTSFAIPVVATVQTGAPGAVGSLDRSTIVFEANFAWWIAVFLLLAAADHLLMAAPGVHRWYERKLADGINYARWIEYSVSASIMICLIALLTGINSLYALIAIFGVNAAMILFGLTMEQVNRHGRDLNWSPFVFGCIAGIVPWAAITSALVVANVDAPPGGDAVPGFVYGIFVSLFLLFNCFALNQWLQYRRRGRFADYLFGEKVYLILSLVAKSALAWQIFAGTLAS
jgi:hypothetical protein